MPLPPNMAAGDGDLGAKKRYLRDRRQQRKRADRAAERAGERDRPRRNRPNRSSTPAPPARPQYGPYRQRAEREANIQFDPLEQALNQQLVNISGTATQPGWFDQYKAAVLASGQQVASNYQAAQNEIANRQMVDPAGGMSPELQSAMGAQGAVNTAFQNLLTSANTADQNYYAGRGNVADASKLSAQLDTSKAQGDLARERGQFVLVRRDELKDLAHTRRLENAAFGLDQAKAVADVQDDLRDDRRERRENRRERRDDRRDERRDARQENREVITSGPFAGYTKKQVRALSPEAKQRLRDAAKADGESGDGGSKFTPLQQREARQNFRKVFRDIKRNDNGLRSYRETIKNTLIDAGADPLLVKAALQAYFAGRPNSATAKALFRDYGIKVSNRKPRKRPAPTEAPEGRPHDSQRP